LIQQATTCRETVELLAHAGDADKLDDVRIRLGVENY
jgi:hypothetical protein